MKFSLSWLREFVEVSDAPADLARRLTSAGLVVETVAREPDGDAVLDIEIFPNRPDCMNVYGVAREVAAATGRALCPFPGDIQEDASSPPAASLARVSIEDAGLCGRYSARVIDGVHVGPSPEWLVRRLAGMGLRPVNNVVDATNYVLWEFGHPLHAFDLDTLKGREIRVRRARRGESMTTLDGAHRVLDADTLVIADAERPVAIAGVMGGAATMVTERTTRLLIESAHFDPISVRRTSKRLALTTDASYRFERGADIDATVIALNRASGLVRQIAGGAVNPGLLDVRPAPAVTRRLRLRAARVALLLGLEVDPETIARGLRTLHFTVEPGRDASGDVIFDVEVPSHRHDIDREVDLIEEVARGIGYDRVPERLPTIAGSGGVSRAGHRQEHRLRRALESAGCSEAITLSFVASSVDWGLRQRLDPAEPAIEPIALANPIAADEEILRTTLLPGLLAAAARNVNRGMRDVRLYEIGRTFRRGPVPPPSHEDRKRAPIGPVDEILTMSIALTGDLRPRHWMEPPRATTLFDLKGLLESALAEVGHEVAVEPLAASEAFAPGRSAALRIDQRRIGRMGELSRRWCDRFDLRQEVFLAELNLSELVMLPRHPITFRPLPRYPAVSRDLSLVVARHQTYRDLEEAVRGVAPDRIARVSLVDRYAGDALPPGTVGLSVNVIYQAPDGTLSSDEVADLQKRVLETLTQRFGAKLREQKET